MPRWAIDITAGTGGFEAAAKRISGAMKKEADKSTSAMDDFSKDASRGIGNVAKAGKLAFPVLGGLGERIKGAVEGFAALGPAGIAVGAAVGIAAVGSAAIGAAAGVVKLTDAAYGYIAEIKKLQSAGVSLVSPEQIENVEQAHFALEGVRAAGHAATVILASEFAPAVERVAVDTLALVLLLQTPRRRSARVRRPCSRGWIPQRPSEVCSAP